VRSTQQSLGSRHAWGRRLRLWLPVVVYAAGIFAASSMSRPPVPDRLSDKSWHGAAYAGLGLIALRAFAGAELAGVTVRTSLSAISLATVYGASDEVHQMFVAERTADMRDLVADAAGAAAGVTATWLVAALIRRRTSRESRI
jgi:VanZ family protein